MVFNRNLSSKAAKQIDELNAFPHVQEKLLLFWGEKEGREYLKELMFSYRGNNVVGQGFPLSATTVISRLYAMHDDEFPKFIPIESVWDPFSSRF